MQLQNWWSGDVGRWMWSVLQHIKDTEKPWEVVVREYMHWSFSLPLYLLNLQGLEQQIQTGLPHWSNSFLKQIIFISWHYCSVYISTLSQNIHGHHCHNHCIYYFNSHCSPHWNSLIIHLVCNYSPFIYSIIHLEKKTKQKLVHIW